MKSRIVIIVLFSSLLLSGGLSHAGEDLSFKVIINASNPNSKLTPQEISKLFLKKVKRWKESDEAVLPVDLVADSTVREDFSKEIHGRKIVSIKAYWQKKIFSGRDVPPPEKASDKEVLKYVEENAGAIGYVAVSTAINQDKVKVITITK